MKKDVPFPLAGHAFRWSLVTLLVVLGAQLLASARGLTPWVNWDVAMNLVTGQKLLSGARLYVDWIDNNPPPAYLLAAVVARLATSPLAQVTLYHGLIFALGIAGLLTLRTLRRDAADEGQAVAYAMVAAMTLGATIEAHYFAQRDHLIAIVIVVYGALRGLDARGLGILPWAFVLGLAAAQKPHMLLLVAAWEVALASRPPRALVTALLAGVALPYVAYFFLAPSDIGAMIDWAFRYHVSPAGRAFRAHSLSSILQDSSCASTAMAAALTILVLLAARGGDRLPARPAAAALALLAAGTFVTLGPAKYYPYHFFALAAAVLLAGFFALLRFDARHRRALALALLIALGALGAKRAMLLADHALAAEPLASHEVTRALTGKGRVALVTTSAYDVLAAFYAGVELVGPWPYHLDFPLLMHTHGDARDDALAAYAAGPMQEVLAAEPDVILFSPSNYALPHMLQNAYPVMLRMLAPHLDLSAYDARVFASEGNWVAFERRSKVESPRTKEGALTGAPNFHSLSFRD